MGERLGVAGMHVLCLPFIASVMLVLGSSSAPPGSAPHGGVAPLGAPVSARQAAPDTRWMPGFGVAPLGAPVSARQTAPDTKWMPGFGVAPLSAPGSASADPGVPASKQSPTVAAPLGPGPSLAPDRTDPRTLRVVRLELLVGPVWRIRTAEALFLASLAVGRLQGFSGIFQAGMFVAPDRNFVAVNDFPIGGGFVARRRLGQRSLFGSVGFTAGILVHRAATDFGVIHRVDPDFQVPLRLDWTAGRVGFTVALLQGFSVRTRTYARRGVDVWRRIPYRIGLAVGLHFDAGIGRAKPRRAAR